jgi:predicted small lipoprotein YifL
MWRVLIACCVLASLAGCGGGGPDIPLEDTVPVTGTATFQGKPLESYRVYFSNEKNRTASGVTGADGRFVLGTNNQGDGAPVGTHKVWLMYEPNVEVAAGQETPEASGPPPKVKLPAKYSNPTASGLTAEVPAAGLTDYKLDLK